MRPFAAGRCPYLNVTFQRARQCYQLLIFSLVPADLA